MDKTLLINCLIVLLCQWLYIVVKFMGVRQIVGSSFKKRLIITNIASLVWLFATFMGVNQMIQGNYVVIMFYLIGSTIGIITEQYIRKFI